MKKILAITAILATLVILVMASMARVPAGSGAWCNGRYLGPGLQLKSPFSKVVPYPTGLQKLEHDAIVTLDGGSSIDVDVELTYRWNHQRLSAQPINPTSMVARLQSTLASLDGRYGRAGIGARVRQTVENGLADLPIDIVRSDVGYGSEAFEDLASVARPTGEKVVVVGLDGFDWVLLDRLIGEGKCPTFAEMKLTAAWGEIISRPPVLSPLIWTTMGTGRMPEEHGILDFVVTDPESGKDTPITNQFRKVHAFWNLLSYVDIKVNIVNWWATYPAEPLNGVMVSERVFYQLFGIRPSLDDPANIYPPEVIEDILALLVEADDIGYDEITQYVHIDRAEFDAALDEARLAENPFENRINHLRKIIAVTRGVFNVGHWLLENRPAGVTALYVEGTDTIGHRFAHFLPPKLRWVDETDYRKYKDAMARYYELVDEELGRLMKAAPADTTWIVVPDHGFFTGAARPSVPPDDWTVGAPQWHRMVGAFLASGPNVRPGKLPRVHIDDLCRTMLWLQGAPISRGLRGRELVELMRPEWVQAHDPVFVDGYEELPKTWMGRDARSMLDDARIQELEALGYLQSGGGGHEEFADDGNPLEAKATEPYNLGKIAERRGDLAAAEGHFLRALEIEPSFSIAMRSLAGVYRIQGKHEQSLRWTLRALQTGSQLLPPMVLLDFVSDAEAAGRLDRALPALDLIRERWKSTSTYYTARGRVYKLQHQVEAAEREFRAALAIDPADPVATEELLVLAAQGRPVDTARILEDHLNAVETDLKKLNDLAVVCLRQGRPELAERALKRVLESDPTNPGVASNLGIALQMQGRGSEAAEVLGRTVEARPEDGNLRFNYGAVLASLGRHEEALRQFDAAERAGAEAPRMVTAKAKVLVRLGRIDEGRRVLEAGAKKYPDHAEIRELLGVLQGG